MKRLLLTALALALGLATSAAAQDARFDVQLFRPSGAPQDLVMVGQSRPLAHLSASGGFFFNFSLDPLVLVNKEGGSSNKILSIVGSRLQLDAIASVGILDWAEVGVDMPLVLAQAGDNLEAIGTEGPIQGYVLGDLRLTGKVAIPGLRRRAEDSGLGAALTLGLSLPTGEQQGFASDGEFTYTPGLVVDYRFSNGILVSAAGGLWNRPDHIFNGVLVGDMAPFGLATEIPILRGRGITAVGMVHGAVGLDKLPSQPRDVPAELLFGLRWYSSTGLTFTVGGGGGCGCSLQAPSLRFFSSIVWVPAKTSEWEALEKFKKPPEPPPPPPPDLDGDGVTDDKDVCPKEPGLSDRGGCPIRDADGDGVEDSIDRCPDVAPGPGGKNGCPMARIQGNKILILENVNFATDQDVILSESFPVLEEVSQVLKTHPEIQRILIEGHTDSRAGEVYNLDLSKRRAASVRTYLEESGVEPVRLCSQGFGQSRPLAENDNEEGMARNRRVEFTLLPPPSEGEPRCPGGPVEKPGKKRSGGKRSAPATKEPAPRKP
ncbi:outer membrane exchange protein TraB [Hyalangium sp.]|uniref:outer membrane exchange protein TraB n=1 Tax=Hyalangium sp. TaxID=2028555 RepID=UPI002D587413|nr:outer membrane exchange protein TraB [Hyalangium sp.]HYH95714.1 outer membrane exchange protein TraB [Hyalangium sp.]